MATATVTVMFSDIVGSTDLSTRLGEDDADRARRAYLRALRDAVDDHGGSEVKSLGDGLMACFASASEAVASAIEMQRNITRLNRRDPTLDLALRVGLSHGDATSEDGDWFGTPVIEASRLCAAAAPGQIVATAVVRSVASRRPGHEFCDIAPVVAKGLPEAVPAVEVGWQPPHPDESPLPAGLTTSLATVFVGRESDLDELGRSWKAAVTGERSAVLLSGEPGIGKTRLAAELARRAHAEAGVIAYGHCDEHLGVPYQPFASALRPLVAEMRDPELADAVGDGGPHLARLLPEVGQRLGAAPAPWTEPDSDRFVLFRTVAALLAAASDPAPILFVLDDVHWATKPTLLLLRHLLRTQEPMKVMLLATYRDSELDPAHPLADLLADLRRDGGAERVKLTGLDVAAIEAFVGAVSDSPVDDRLTRFAQALHAETEGNPFFVKEMLAHLAETGRLDEDSGAWTTEPLAAGADLPESVREVVGHRLARLSPAATAALTVAAVIGRRFVPSLLEHIAEAGDPEKIFDAIEEAVSAQLVVDAGGRHVEFAHAIVHQALYSGLTSARRARLHRRVGEALESLPDADRHVPALAYHFGEAAADGVAEQAARYGLEAARDALARFAYEEALAHLQRCTSALGLLDEPEPSLRLGVLLAMADTHIHAGSDWDAVRDAALDAADVARAIGSAEGLGLAAAAVTRFHPVGVDDPDVVRLVRDGLEAAGDSLPGLRARAMAGMVLAGLAHHLGEAETVSLDALALADASGEARAKSDALTARGFVLRHRGRARAYLDVAEQALALAAPGEDDFIHHNGVNERARARLILGDPAGFHADVAALARAAERMGGQYEFWAVNHRIVQMLLDGDFAAAEAAASVAMGEVAHPNDSFLVLGQLMVTLWEQGRFDELLPVLAEVAGSDAPVAFQAGHAAIAAEAGDTDRARAILEGLLAGGVANLPADVAWLGSIALLAHAAAHLGAADAAQELAPALEPHAGTLVVVASTVAALGAADRYRGMLAMTRGDHDAAHEYYRRALELEGHVGSRPLLARTRLWLARLTNSADLAREVLADAEALGMRALADHARSLA